MLHLKRFSFGLLLISILVLLLWTFPNVFMIGSLIIVLIFGSYIIGMVVLDILNERI